MPKRITLDDDLLESLNIEDSVLYNSPITINVTQVEKEEPESNLEDRAKFYKKVAESSLIGESDVPWIRENLELPDGPGIGEPLIKQLEKAKSTSVITLREDQNVDIIHPSQHSFFYRKVWKRVMLYYTFIIAIGITAIIASENIGTALNWFIDTFGMPHLIFNVVMISFFTMWGLITILKPHDIMVMQ
jgi:hypothetical protein